jgi:hypothetical protein
MRRPPFATRARPPPDRRSQARPRSVSSADIGCEHHNMRYCLKNRHICIKLGLASSGRGAAGNLPLSWGATSPALGAGPLDERRPRRRHLRMARVRSGRRRLVADSSLIAEQLIAAGQPVSRRSLRAGGVRGSNSALGALAHGQQGACPLRTRTSRRRLAGVSQQLPQTAEQHGTYCCRGVPICRATVI